MRGVYIKFIAIYSIFTANLESIQWSVNVCLHENEKGEKMTTSICVISKRPCGVYKLVGFVCTNEKIALVFVISDDFSMIFVTVYKILFSIYMLFRCSTSAWYSRYVSPTLLVQLLAHHILFHCLLFVDYYSSFHKPLSPSTA